MPSGLEQLVLSEYAISSISNLPKSKKSTKTSFSKIVEKLSKVWKPGDQCKGKKLKSLKNIYLDYSEWFGAKKIGKIVKKWLEGCNQCKLSDIQKKVPDFGSNHLFSRIGPFWVIWSNKNFFDFWIIQNFQKPNLTLKKIFLEPDFSGENRLARFLPL